MDILWKDQIFNLRTSNNKQTKNNFVTSITVPYPAHLFSGNWDHNWRTCHLAQNLYLRELTLEA